MILQWNWGAEEKKKGEDGFNNAGILTFNSHAINSFIRELFQNSNDAKSEIENKIKIQIEYKEISKDDIPEFPSYISILNAVKGTHTNQKKFFLKADEILKNNTIPFLIYSDFNTKGLTGREEDSYSSFVACVLSEGISAKENKNAGGSYGIGKNAIYGVSNLRTVFYSSMDLAGTPIFQGVAKLASYKSNGKNHEGRIYLGLGNDRLSVRNKKDIPKIFERNEPGLSQYVMGVELDKLWQNDFARAVLRNYWKLLIEGGLEVEIIEKGEILLEINSKNTAYLINSLFKDEIIENNLTPFGNPLLFYDAFINGNKIEFEIPLIGKCSFFYKESDQGENNIAYMRNGMVIFSKIEKRLVGANVTGVFVCDSDFGNEILRKMEPPKHDSFEPQMLEDNHENLSRKEGEKILANIKSKVREVIKTLIKKYKEEIETPAFLTELFEDLQKSIVSGSKGERKNEKSKTETIYRKGIEEEITLSLFSEDENTYVSDLDGELKENGKGEGMGVSPQGKNKSKIKGGISTKGGGSKGGNTPKYPIKSRVFHYGDNKELNIYKCIIHSEKDIPTAELNLVQYADSGEDVAFQLKSVKDIKNNELKFSEIKDADDFIIDYKLSLNLSEGKNIFFFEIIDNQKSAFLIKG